MHGGCFIAAAHDTLLPGGADAAASFPVHVAAEGAEDVLVAELPGAQPGSSGAPPTARVRVPAAWPGPGQTLALEDLCAGREGGETGSLGDAAEGGALKQGLAAALERLHAEGARAWTGSLLDLLTAAAAHAAKALA